MAVGPTSPPPASSSRAASSSLAVLPAETTAAATIAARAQQPAAAHGDGVAAAPVAAATTAQPTWPQLWGVAKKMPAVTMVVQPPGSRAGLARRPSQRRPRRLPSSSSSSRRRLERGPAGCTAQRVLLSWHWRMSWQGMVWQCRHLSARGASSPPLARQCGSTPLAPVAASPAIRPIHSHTQQHLYAQCNFIQILSFLPFLSLLASRQYCLCERPGPPTAAQPRQPAWRLSWQAVRRSPYGAPLAGLIATINRIRPAPPLAPSDAPCQIRIRPPLDTPTHHHHKK